MIINKNFNILKLLLNNGFIDLLFDQLYNLINISNPIRSLSIINLFSILIIEKPLLISNLNKFCENLIYLILNNFLNDKNFFLSYFRLLFFLIDSIKNFYNIEKYHELFYNLINNFKQNNNILIILNNFILKNIYPSFHFINYLKILINNNLSIEIFEIIYQIINHKYFDRPLPLLQILLNLLFNNNYYLWSRILINLIINILNKFNDQNLISTWFLTYLKRFSLFLGCSLFKKKYFNKQILIIEFFEQLYLLNIKWLHQPLQIYISSLINYKLLNLKLFKLKFEKMTDYIFIGEIEQNNLKNLKFFLNFNLKLNINSRPNTPQLILPFNSNKSKVKQTKTSAYRIGMVRSISLGLKKK